MCECHVLRWGGGRWSSTSLLRPALPGSLLLWWEKAHTWKTLLLAVTPSHPPPHTHTQSDAHGALKPTAVTFQMQMEQPLPSTAKMSTSSALTLLLRTAKLAAGQRSHELNTHSVLLCKTLKTLDAFKGINSPNHFFKSEEKRGAPEGSALPLSLFTRSHSSMISSVRFIVVDCEICGLKEGRSGGMEARELLFWDRALPGRSP